MTNQRTQSNAGNVLRQYGYWLTSNQITQLKHALKSMNEWVNFRLHINQKRGSDHPWPYSSVLKSHKIIQTWSTNCKLFYVVQQNRVGEGFNYENLVQIKLLLNRQFQKYSHWARMVKIPYPTKLTFLIKIITMFIEKGKTQFIHTILRFYIPI